MAGDYLEIPKRRQRIVRLSSFFGGFNSSADGTILPPLSASDIRNFDFSDGALKCGYGLEECVIKDKAKYVWLYKMTNEDGQVIKRIMYLGCDFKLYEQTENGFAKIDSVEFTAVPLGANYRLYGEDVMLFLSPADGMYVYYPSGEIIKIENAPYITSFTMHYERMFVTSASDKTMLHFSDDLDPTNWDEGLTAGGFIQMLDERGDLNKALSFLNYVYVFRDFGISRVTAYADQSEFSAVNLFVSAGKINSKTVAECGDKVLFLSGKSLCRFDGVSTGVILSEVSGVIENAEHACAAYFDGKYFAALKFKPPKGSADTDGKNNGLLVYDFKKGGYHIVYGVDISALCVLEDTLYAVTSEGKTGIVTKCGAFFGEACQKVYVSGESDFDTGSMKTVKEFAVQTDKSFTLTVKSERQTKNFTVPPSYGGVSVVNLNVAGKKIGFTLTTDENLPNISRPIIKIVSH